MAKKHHCGRKDRPQRVCNPDACPNCMYVGEGDSWCDKIGEIVLSDWEPTEYYMGVLQERKRKVTALEIFKTILKWLQIMAVSYATGVLIVSEIPKRKAPLCDKCAHLRFKRAKNDVCCRYVCNFWDLPPFDDPPEFCNRFEEKK